MARVSGDDKLLSNVVLSDDGEPETMHEGWHAVFIKVDGGSPSAC